MLWYWTDTYRHQHGRHLPRPIAVRQKHWILIEHTRFIYDHNNLILSASHSWHYGKTMGTYSIGLGGFQFCYACHLNKKTLERNACGHCRTHLRSLSTICCSQKTKEAGKPKFVWTRSYRKHNRLDYLGNLDYMDWQPMLNIDDINLLFIRSIRWYYW